MTTGMNEIKSKCIDFEMPLDWGIDRKREYLEACLFELKDLMKKAVLRLVNPYIEPVERELICGYMKDWQKEKDKANAQLRELEMARKSSISDDMIIKAKNHPIENLIEVKKKFALCPFHTDRNPSFYVHNGYGYCFSCQEQADSIKIAMKVHCLNFTEAVRFLN